MKQHIINRHQVLFCQSLWLFLLLPKIFRLLNIHCFEYTWCSLFQTRTVHTILDIYVFVYLKHIPLTKQQIPSELFSNSSVKICLDYWGRYADLPPHGGYLVLIQMYVWWYSLAKHTMFTTGYIKKNHTHLLTTCGKNSTSFKRLSKETAI